MTGSTLTELRGVAQAGAPDTTADKRARKGKKANWGRAANKTREPAPGTVQTSKDPRRDGRQRKNSNERRWDRSKRERERGGEREEARG